MSKELVILFCIFAPVLILWLTYRFKVLNKVGSIIIAYIIGCAFGLTGLIPDTEEMHGVQTTVASVAIPIAIPLLLFSSDLRSWVRLAPSFIKSTLCGIVGCAIAITIGFLICGRQTPELYANIGGMLTGLYTGGNANLASLKMALGVDDSTYILVSAYSTIMSALYLFFVIIVGKRVLLCILPDFKKQESEGETECESEGVKEREDEGARGKEQVSLPSRGGVMGGALPFICKALLLTIIIIAASAGIAMLFPKDSFQPVFILALSTLSIGAAMIKKVRALPLTFETGTFFILVFSIAVASQVSLRTLTEVDKGIFLFTTIATLGALLFHVLLSAVLRIDTDTTLTTSISLVCSPPFAPVIGSALRNKAVIGPGIAVGLFGYAVGTYLGFAIAKMLLVL